MRRFVPRDKMSSKARKALDQEKRNVWAMSPVTRVRESAKVYNRKKYKHCLDE